VPNSVVHGTDVPGGAPYVAIKLRCMTIGGSGHQSSGPHNPPPTVAVPPGWYPDPDSANIDRWWDGGEWTSHRRPAAPTGSGGNTGTDVRQVVGFLCLALGLVGAGMALFIEVSILTGTGMVWTGAVLAAVGAIGAGVLRAKIGTRIVCLLLAILAVASAAYDQHELNEKRHQLEQILNRVP